MQTSEDLYTDCETTRTSHPYKIMWKEIPAVALSFLEKKMRWSVTSFYDFCLLCHCIVNYLGLGILLYVARKFRCTELTWDLCSFGSVNKSICIEWLFKVPDIKFCILSILSIFCYYHFIYILINIIWLSKYFIGFNPFL